MIVVGVSGACGWDVEQNWIHSAGCSLWIDGTHHTSISEERLSRIKYDGRYPQLSIKYCLENAKLTNDDINMVCYAENIHSLFQKNSIVRILKREFPNAEIEFADHHICHAYSSYFTSGFENSSILSLDGAGNSISTRFQGIVGYETGLYALAIGKSLTVLHHSINGISPIIQFNICQIYNNISRYIYSRIEPDKVKRITNPYLFMESAPGKIMGLSAYGNYKKIDLENLWEIKKDDYFPQIIDVNIPHSALMDQYSPQDIAAWLQFQWEFIIIEFFEELKQRRLIYDNLCLSGGMALNVLSNAKLQKLFRRIYVPPFPNDTGLAIGSALYSCNKHEEKIQLLDTAYLGKEYSDHEIEKELNKFVSIF